jgi:rhamnosyltransferase subunit B
VRFTLATWGSFGDLHPFLAIGKGLARQGHSVTLCTGSIYRQKAEQEGLRWARLRPELPPPEESAALLEKLMDPRHGSRRVIGEWIMPGLGEMLTDLRAALEGADALVTHPILYAAPVAAKEAGVPWVGTFLAPILLPSAYDLPIPPSYPGMGWVNAIRPPLSRWVLGEGKRQLRRWAASADALRQLMELPSANPLFEGMHSETLNLALFSRALALPQPDWPANTVQTGFPFYDRLQGGDEDRLPATLEAFLQSGSPPILFTLGSSAVMAPGRFFTLAIETTQKLGVRAVLLTGKGVVPPPDLPPGIVSVGYAPHSLIMPRCSAIVHQGGVGTTGQALRSGRPQLIVPFSHDQPDNAWRIARAGAGRVLPIRKLTGPRLLAALSYPPAPDGRGRWAK